jgi:hypothetical protein
MAGMFSIPTVSVADFHRNRQTLAEIVAAADFERMNRRYPQLLGGYIDFLHANGLAPGFRQCPSGQGFDPGAEAVENHRLAARGRAWLTSARLWSDALAGRLFR